MITVKDINHFYGKFHALRNINFEIPSGRVAGFIGPNGSGKSTTLKILSSYLVPASGEVIIDGLPLSKRSVEARKRIGYVPETPTLYKELKVYDYMNFVATVKGIEKTSWKEQKGDIFEMCGLNPIKNRIISNLSKGNRQRVALAQALIGQPSILLLDEPTSALDPAQTIDMRNFIKALSGKVTILITSHILAEIAQMCDFIVMIKNGEITYAGNIEEVGKTGETGAKNVLLVFSSLNDHIISLLKTIPGGDFTKADRANSVIATVHNEGIFFPSFFELVSENNLPLREILNEENKLESFFKRR